MSGPYAGMMLADLGAEVVKVETAKGDAFRRFGRPETPFSAVFANCNRSKRSVVLDLKDPGGRTALLELLAASDVFLANWRAGVAESLGLTDAVLADTNPKLVRCFVTGFGPDGPLSSEPAFDTVLQARSGVTDAINRPGDDPRLIPGYPVDKLVGMMAAQAILAALFERESTGVGDRIEVSMLDVASYVNFVDLFTNRVFLDHQPDTPQNQQAPRSVPCRTRDGWIVCAPVTAPQIAATFRALGHPEWTDDVLAQPNQHTLVHVMFDTIERATRRAHRRRSTRVLPRGRRTGRQVRDDGRAPRRPAGRPLAAVPRHGWPASAGCEPSATRPASAGGATSPPRASHRCSESTRPDPTDQVRAP